MRSVRLERPKPLVNGFIGRLKDMGRILGRGRRPTRLPGKLRLTRGAFLRSPAQLSPFTDSPRQFEPAIGPIVSLGSRDSEPGLVSWDLRHCASRLFF